MTGKMNRRRNQLGKRATGLAKSFHDSQKPNSKRAKKKARRNDYTDQSHQVREDK
jgi:hypothetical protein